MSQALINRSLTNVRTELEFLYESNVITKSLYDNLIATLPERYSGQPAVDLQPTTSSSAAVAQTDVSSTTSVDATPQYSELTPSRTSSTVSAASPIEIAEVIYDFHPQQPSDLKLTRGDRVEVLEKLNADWWKGKIGNNEGVFPSNYVKLVSPSSTARTTHQQQQSPPVIYTQNSSNNFQQQPPFPPASTGYYNEKPPQQYQPPPPAQQFQPLPVQQQPVMVQQQQNNSHPHLRKFGKQLKDAAVFGAGATIGSDIVNSIF